MSIEEIRRLAESHVLVNFCGKKHLDGEPCTECFDHSEHTCQDNEAIKAALLAYAAMVERCERLKFNMIPHKHDTEIVDYILKGVKQNEET